MKILALGDIHGNPIWKKIVEKEKFDKVVFIGDYFDSLDFTPAQQIDNFKDIIAFKDRDPDKIHILIGNHDYHYLNDVWDRYSGYNHKFAFTYRHLLESNIDKMQMCFLIDKYLFTHAGVSNTWLKEMKRIYKQVDKRLPIDKYINELFKISRSAFLFQMGDNFSNTGDDITQSPIWIRPRSLMQSRVPKYTHIVGHTQLIQMLKKPVKNIFLIDALNTTKEYLLIDNNELIINKLDEK